VFKYYIQNTKVVLSRYLLPTSKSVKPSRLQQVRFNNKVDAIAFHEEPSPNTFRKPQGVSGKKHFKGSRLAHKADMRYPWVITSSKQEKDREHPIRRKTKAVQKIKESNSQSPEVVYSTSPAWTGSKGL
jgi:hypothetical protein